MKLTVEIDDNDLNEIVAKGIRDLDEETITGLAKDAVSAYLQQDKVMQEILFKSNGYFQNEKALRPEILNMLGNSFTEKEIQKYRQKLIETIEKHGEQIIINVMSNVFSNMLVSNDFRTQLGMAVAKVAALTER